VSLPNLPAFSPVASKLMMIFGHEHVNFREAADLVRSDAAFSTEILRLANSSLTGMRFPCLSILHAITLLGVKHIASLATTLCVGKLVKQVSKLPLMRQCWRHNLATALIARSRAEHYDLDADDAYMFGLLAGIGRLALLVSDPEAYQEIAYRAETEGISLDLLEANFFGFDNRQAARWLVSEWHLPIELLKVYSIPNGSNLARLILDAGNEADRLGFAVLSDGIDDDLRAEDPAAYEIAESVNRVEQELGI
jgi:HD-like signal output (HDOD) protein